MRVLAPDAETLRQPCVEIPIVRRAAKLVAGTQVAHPVEPEESWRIFAAGHLAHEVGDAAVYQAVGHDTAPAWRICTFRPVFEFETDAGEDCALDGSNGFRRDVHGGTRHTHSSLQARKRIEVGVNPTLFAIVERGLHFSEKVFELRRMRCSLAGERGDFGLESGNFRCIRPGVGTAQAIGDAETLATIIRYFF